MLPRRSLLTLALGLALTLGARPAASDEPAPGTSSEHAPRTSSRPAPETPGAGNSETPDRTATLEKRVDELEAQMAVVNRKFKMLGSDDSGFTDALASPTFLYEQAMAIVGSTPLARLSLDDHMKAYRYLALFHQLHPDRPENENAFLVAALLFKRIWFATRYKEPDSAWQVAEPYFMFQWLTDFFRPDGPFPRPQVGTLLAGLPQPFYEKFEAFAQAYERPERVKRWRFAMEEDDGIVQVVTGELREEPKPDSREPKSGS